MKQVFTVLFCILCLHCIAAPTRSGVSAMHTRFTAEEDTQPWYVTDGLIAHFDGIYNVGYGQHDQSTTRWYSLVGDFYWPITVAYDDCVSFTGSEAVRNQNGAEASFNVLHDLTLHSVVTTPSSVIWTMQSLIALGRDSFSKNGFVLGGVSGYGTFQAYWKSAYSGGTAYYVDTGKGANEQFVLDIVFFYDELIFDVYIDGTKVGRRTIAPEVWNLDGKTDIRLRMGANSGALNDVSGFRLHEVMLYERALTEEEIQWNYTLDVGRFGL